MARPAVILATSCCPLVIGATYRVDLVLNVLLYNCPGVSGLHMAVMRWHKTNKKSDEEASSRPSAMPSVYPRSSDTYCWWVPPPCEAVKLGSSQIEISSDRCWPISPFRVSYDSAHLTIYNKHSHVLFLNYITTLLLMTAHPQLTPSSHGMVKACGFPRL